MEVNAVSRECCGGNTFVAKLPPEILTIVLRYAKSAKRRRDFLCCIMVCRRWAEVGKRVAWESIALNASTLKSFIHLVEHAPEACRLLRSLSLQLHTPWPSVEECQEHEKRINQAHFDGPNAEAAGLWTRLEKLADILRSHMLGLQTFSLRIGRAGAGDRGRKYSKLPHGAWISSSIIANLLDALPESCIDLELDTGGRDDDPFCIGGTPSEPAHLCDSIRALLPRTRHLRLRLRSFCPDFFSHETDGVRDFINAPRLESTFINLDSYPSDLEIVKCFASKWTLQCIKENDPTWRTGCDHRKRTNNCFMIQLGKILQAAYNRGAFPRATAIRTVDLSRNRGSGEEHHNYITQQRISTNQTDIFPVIRLWGWDASIDDRKFFFQDKHRTELAGSMDGVEDMIDRDNAVWITTTEGDRWTTKFHNSELRHTVPTRMPRLLTRAGFLELCSPRERLEAELCIALLKDQSWDYGPFRTMEGLLG